MGFKLLFASIIIIAGITVIFNSSYDNKNPAASLVSFKKIPTKKEFFQLRKSRRRHHQTIKSSNVTTTEILIRILLLSGDIEVNPGPWTCDRCSQNFRHQQKFNNHIINQETVSCRFCNTNFCSTRKCYSHERTCPARLTNQPERVEQLNSELWKCTRCDQNFDRLER